jgi:hypothetical protein
LQNVPKQERIAMQKLSSHPAKRNTKNGETIRLTPELCRALRHVHKILDIPPQALVNNFLLADFGRDVFAPSSGALRALYETAQWDSQLERSKALARLVTWEVKHGWVERVRGGAA